MSVLRVKIQGTTLRINSRPLFSLRTGQAITPPVSFAVSYDFIDGMPLLKLGERAGVGPGIHLQDPRSEAAIDGDIESKLVHGDRKSVV